MPLHGDNRPLLVWSDELAIGHPDIDQEHRQLIVLFGRLADPTHPINPAQREFLLDELVSHVCVHFDHEEALMRQSDYPDAARHRDAHMFLLDQINRYLALAKIHPDEVSDEELPPFVASWLEDHIRGDDRALGEYLKSLVNT